MESKEFVNMAKDMAEYVSKYLDNIRERRVLPDLEPGYLRPLLPAEAPATPDKWEDLLSDVENIIMPGVSHWQSPNFHAYFPTAQSYPAILADMLSGGIACIGFTWMSSPACTELEVVMLDWLGKMCALPPEFISSTPGGHGGGVIQGTASEATLVALFGAKSKVMRLEKEKNPDTKESDILPRLVGYASEQSHSSVERAGLLGGVTFRLIETNDKFQMEGAALEKAIKEDKAKGLIPFYVVATLGTTTVCSFDNLAEIGPVCQRQGVWLHIDAAYAGAAFICPEFRHLMKGVEFSDSFNFNPHKLMLVNFDCSTMWLKDPDYVVNSFKVDPVYLRHSQQSVAPDYRHWQIPLGRRFRSLKLWFVLRLYGVENLQAHIRKHAALAKEFEALVRSDPRFEIIGEVLLGLVCFRLKGDNATSEKLLSKINGRGKIHMVPSTVQSTYFIRFAVCARTTESSDIKYAWEEILAMTAETLAEK